MATATVKNTPVVTLTLDEDEATYLRYLLGQDVGGGDSPVTAIRRAMNAEGFDFPRGDRVYRNDGNKIMTVRRAGK